MTTPVRTRILAKMHEREDPSSNKSESKNLEKYENSFLPEARRRVVKSKLIRGKKIVNCIPASIKAEFLNQMKRRSQKSAINRKANIGNTSENEQSIIKRINTFAILTEKTPTCSKVQLESMMDNIFEAYSDVGNDGERVKQITSDFIETKEEADLHKRLQTSGAYQKDVDERATEKLELEGKSTIDPALRSIARDEIIKSDAKKKIETKVEDVDSYKDSKGLISKIHESTGRELLNFVKKSQRKSPTDKSPMENVRASPCGLRINLGFSRDGLQLAQDKLAFMGSGEDWHDYYVKGKTLSEVNRGGNITFMKIHSKDWNGCVKDIYERKDRLDYNDLAGVVQIKNKGEFIIPEQEFNTSHTTLPRKNEMIVGYKEESK